MPALTDILVSNAGTGRIDGYAAAQALFCLGGTNALEALDQHLFQLDEYNERLAAMYVFHWEMPEPHRSQFIQQYLLKNIGQDLELTLEAKTEDGGRTLRFRLTFKNVSTRLLDLLPLLHHFYLRSGDGRFLPRSGSIIADGLKAQWLRLKPNESQIVEVTGQVKPAKAFEPYEQKLAKDATARGLAKGVEVMLMPGFERYFLDKPEPFEAIFVLEQTPLAAVQKSRLKLEYPWIGRAVSAPVTITLGKQAWE